MKNNSPHSTLNYLIDEVTEFEDEGCLILIGCHVEIYPDVYNHAIIYPIEMDINPRLDALERLRFEKGDCLYVIHILDFDGQKQHISEIIYRIASRLLDKFKIVPCYDGLLRYDADKKIFLRKL